MRAGLFFADRTAVLFLGVAAGAAIGYAFGVGGEAPVPAPVAPSPAPTRAAAGTGAVSAKPDITQECALPFQPHLLDAVSAGRPVTVGVFGDSFGDGVYSALYRLLPAREDFRVLKYSQQSTGFTRYATRNLEEHAGAQLAADGPVDVAVISFGANDTQGVYANGHAAPLMSQEWQRIVGGRIEGFVRLMRSRGAVVYWLGLPKMRAAAFDTDIAAMNAFYERRMRALRVPFIDIRPLTVDAAGEYAPYLPDPVSHEMRLMRANDGVHMSMNGYVAITRPLAARIKAYVSAARDTTGVVAAVAPPPAVKPAAPVVEPSLRPKVRSTPKDGAAAAPRRKEAPEAPKPASEAAAAPRQRAETPVARTKAEAATPSRPKTEASAPKPKTDTPAPPKAKPEAPAVTTPKAETPATTTAKAKPDTQPAAKPKPETPAAKPEAESKAKPEAKAPAKPATTDKPVSKPANGTGSKPAATPAPRPPLQLNLPPSEESRRSSSPAPTTDQP